MSGAVVTVNIPGEPRKNNDRMLRAECRNARSETIHKAVSEMLDNPAKYLIGRNQGKRTPWKSHPAVKGDEDEQIPGVVNDTVARALA